MTPRPVSERTRAAILRRINSGQPRALVAWTAWRAAGMAAAAAGLVVAGVAIGLRWRQGPPRQEERAAAPVARAEQPARRAVRASVLLGGRDEGIAWTPAGQPLRQIRYRFVDQARWERVGDGPSLTVTVPREEVVLVGLDTY
jgi:hypothetical protein